MAISIKTGYKLTCLEDMKKIRECSLKMGIDVDKDLRDEVKLKTFSYWPIWYLDGDGTEINGCSETFWEGLDYQMMLTLEEFLNENNTYDIWI